LLLYCCIGVGFVVVVLTFFVINRVPQEQWWLLDSLAVPFRTNPLPVVAAVFAAFVLAGGVHSVVNDYLHNRRSRRRTAPRQ
jgi:hypothetical protein